MKVLLIVGGFFLFPLSALAQESISYRDASWTACSAKGEIQVFVAHDSIPKPSFRYLVLHEFEHVRQIRASGLSCKAWFGSLEKSLEKSISVELDARCVNVAEKMHELGLARTEAVAAVAAAFYAEMGSERDSTEFASRLGRLCTSIRVGEISRLAFGFQNDGIDVILACQSGNGACLVRRVTRRQ